jgi:hypothetical protein
MRVIVTVALILLFALVYAAFDMRRDHNQVNKISDECRRAHSDAGEVNSALPTWRFGARRNRSCRKELAAFCADGA